MKYHDATNEKKYDVTKKLRWHPEQITLRKKKLGVESEKMGWHPEQITLREKKLGVESEKMG